MVNLNNSRGKRKTVNTHNGKDSKTETTMPSAEEITRELASAKSMGDFFGKDGIFARLFANTLEQMLEAELTAHLGPMLEYAPE
jgi:hypothetical protein